MTITSPAGELTARRIYQGARAIIIVERDGVELDRMGGKRAERAEAAIVTGPWKSAAGPSSDDADDVVRSWGCRANLEAAQVEARRLATQTSMRTRGKYGRPGAVIPLNHADWAVAVPVVDDGRDFNGALELGR